MSDELFMSDCIRCGFEPENCFCYAIPELTFQHRFCLLTHSNEFSKSSNTGKLIKAMFPDTLVVDWSRTAPSKQLLELIQSECWQAYLLMPEEFAIYQENVESLEAAPAKKLFILLDATWQQARKMYRKSSYLHSLPLMSLDDIPVSRYTLRRNQQDGHLCTAEVAAEILKAEAMYGESRDLHRVVSDFCEHYGKLQQAGKLKK